MIDSNPVPASSQVKSTLTRNQKAAIDRLMAQYPGITPLSVRTNYEHYYFARNWFVWIEIGQEHYRPEQTIARCDHSWTAATKAQAIHWYIEQKLGGQS